MKRRFGYIALGVVLLTTSCKEQATNSLKEIVYDRPVAFNPPTYVCYKTPSKITIDGKLSPAEWDAIPWTSDFTDIEGDKQPAPSLQTRAKMTYDDEGMYFAAWLEEPHVWGNITEHDAVIFHDNDFELFLNPSNDTHNYTEYEVNALGTEWDLFLTKPYRDQGNLVLNNWEFRGMKSAVYVDGTINNPTDIDKSWSIELFIPWSSIYQVVRGKHNPEAGDQMRMNFSRVQWETEVKKGEYVKIPFNGEKNIREHNWVWAPTGAVNIHIPECWGYVQLSDKVAGKSKEAFVMNVDEETKFILRNFYYRQNQFASIFGHYASTLSELQPQSVCSSKFITKLTLYNTLSMYEMLLPAPSGKTWCIRQDGLIWSK